MPTAAQTKVAAPAAIAPDALVAEGITAVTGVASFLASKPWHQSLSVQGNLVSGLGAGVIAYGVPILVALKMPAPDATVLASGVAGVLVSIGVLMGVIGRLRLGGLT